MAQAKHKTRLLLVDDDEDDYLIIRSFIAKVPRSPFKLDWVSTVEQATQAIAAREHDIYLIDYRLGPEDGLELLSRFDLVQRPEPFIILTGAGDDRVEADAMNMGIADYLVKGNIDPELLSRVLRYALQRKHVEAQRIEQLLEINRSKDEFIALASHQLRTPATAVKQYIGMVLEGYAGNITKHQRQLLTSAYDSNERQIRVVNDMLLVARLDLKKMSLSKQAVDLGQLLERIVADAAGALKQREQKLSYTKPSKPVYASVDQEYIRMAISNIFDNASKYTPKSKHIIVSVYTTSQRTACISIKDEGVGIAKEDLERLFKKFSRIHNPLSIQVGGTGLGLYWSKEVVQLHGGSIEVVSVPGEGSTFTISLAQVSAPKKDEQTI
jgi:signal transduction histidine kinase